MKSFYVYILASGRNGTLYIGVTNNLLRRTDEHKSHLAQGFTSTYDVAMLVHYEETTDIHEAIRREKQLKRWNRSWKLELIEKHNPEWRDLADDFGLDSLIKSENDSGREIDSRIKSENDRGKR